MHLHCVDLSANPIRVITGYSERHRIVVTDLQTGPTEKTDEMKWLSDWLKKSRRRFMNPKLHVILDTEMPQTKLKRYTQKNNEKIKSTHTSDGERHHSQAENTREARENATLYRMLCALPQAFHEHTQSTFSPTHHLALQSEVTIASRNELLSTLEQAYGACHKLSVLPLALWSAVLLTYPLQLTMTIATIWITQGITSIIILNKGILTFYRQFPKASHSPELWAQSIKTCIEHFSFSFPWASLDMILLGGDIDHAENIKAWIEGDSNCPCDLITPPTGSRIRCEKNARDVSPTALLPYWPAMGLLYENSFPWHTLYTQHSFNMRGVAA